MLKTPGPPLTSGLFLAFQLFPGLPDLQLTLGPLTFSGLLGPIILSIVLKTLNDHQYDRKKIENTDFIILELVVGSSEQNTTFGIHYEDVNPNRRGVRRPPPSQNKAATLMNSKV
jgi:hypothetical protein